MLRTPVCVYPIIVTHLSFNFLCLLLLYSIYLNVVGRLDVDDQSCAPIGLHKTDAASDWLLINGTALVGKACRESSYKITDNISNRRDF
jgi:hypothetical protein